MKLFHLLHSQKRTFPVFHSYPDAHGLLSIGPLLDIITMSISKWISASHWVRGQVRQAHQPSRTYYFWFIILRVRCDLKLKTLCEDSFAIIVNCKGNHSLMTTRNGWRDVSWAIHVRSAKSMTVIKSYVSWGEWIPSFKLISVLIYTFFYFCVNLNSQCYAALL